MFFNFPRDEPIDLRASLTLVCDLHGLVSPLTGSALDA